MRIESQVSEDGQIILLDFKKDDEPSFVIELDTDESRQLMKMISDTLIKAQVLEDFYNNRFTSEN